MKVVISGTNRGIGRSAALKFLNEGHEVYGLDLLESSITHDRYHHYIADVRKVETLPEISDVEILVVNAGVQDEDSAIDTNLVGAMNTANKYALQSSIKSVLFIASSSARNGFEFPNYSASKSGVVGFMKNLAWRLAKDYKATCNSISFGGVLTESNDAVIKNEKIFSEIMEVTPLKKWTTVEECADWIYFLTVINKSMSGQDVLVDNGENDLNCTFKWPNFNQLLLVLLACVRITPAMKRYFNGRFVGERALYACFDAEIDHCIFEDGESPLKESRNLVITNSEFRWKYPIWYAKNVTCRNVTFKETARSGIWYTDGISFRDSKLLCPKTFRRAKNIELINVEMPDAKETFWGCEGIRLIGVKAKGTYFGMNSSKIEVDRLELDGDYAFDGGKDIVIRDSVLKSKDSFWNCENVTLINCEIDGEYIGWNTKNMTLINCKISSHQGFCYIDNLKLINCTFGVSDLIFELCSNIDADILNEVESIKNPISGRIRVKGVKTLIRDERIIDKRNTEILVNNEKV